MKTFTLLIVMKNVCNNLLDILNLFGCPQLTGFYRGVWSPMGGVALVNAIVFGVYGNLQRGLSDPESLRSQFLAGGIAGLAQSVVSSPVELVKTRWVKRQCSHGSWLRLGYGASKLLLLLC